MADCSIPFRRGARSRIVSWRPPIWARLPKWAGKGEHEARGGSPVWLYLRFTLSYHDVDDLQAERGLDVTTGAGGMAARLLTALIVAFFAATGAHGATFDNCTEHLPFGTPTVTQPAHTSPVCHAGYAALHDDDVLVPRWVAYRLTSAHVFGCLARTNNFHADEELQAGRRARPMDYKRSGYDQGHQAPAEDFAWSAPQMRDSFSMANMTPQLPGLNRAEWERLEETVRAWAWKREEVIVYVGPVLAGSEKTIGADHVAVPLAFWKVIVDPARREAIGFVLPQAKIPKGNLAPWVKSIEAVEEIAGVKLPLPDGVDRFAVGILWPADLRGWRAKHKAVCAN
jgi:endonuclease G